MKKHSSILSALILGTSLIFTACGSDSKSDNNTQADPLELESDGKTLLFYGASTNEQYAYNVEKATLTDLNNNNDEDLTNFAMGANDNGKFVIWIDNKGDNNASNDEEKVVMFNKDYSYSDDGNATWEDFYYLGHYHAEVENGETHHHLAAHANEEFNVTSGAKFAAIGRLNAFLASEASTQSSLTNTLSGTTTLCGFKTVTNDNGTLHYAMGVNGTLYIYDDTFALEDSVSVTDSCEKNMMGISAVSHHDEDGVVVFEANSQKLYVVDSHDDDVFHVHTTYDVSKVLGSGKSAKMMTSLVPVGYEPEEGHEH